jgi:cell division protein FtsB
MHDHKSKVGLNGAAPFGSSSGKAPVPEPLSARALELGRRIWRPAGTLVAFALALLLTWHVINGKHGLNVWLEMRSQDKRLQRDIQDLDKENARLRDRIEHLRSDPDTIMIEARQKLHYAKPDEVIVTLPPEKSDKDKSDKSQSAADTKK